ncbi:hypothetical protein FGCSD_2160 (plasmid) [Streptococcus dysgalactiae]|nr:hypothetical protein FGCSD_2160 [Streptococcus dysgalactiae]
MMKYWKPLESHVRLVRLVVLYDNAVAKVRIVLSNEFVYQETFQSLEELALKTKDYVHW